MALGVQQILTVARRATVLVPRLYDQANHGAVLDGIAKMVPSVGRQKVQTISWAAAFPKLREWVGDRMVQSIFGEDIEITIKPWEITYELDKVDLELNGDAALIGSPQAMAEHFATGLGAGRAHLAYEPLRKNVLAYDGQNLFDTDHTHPNGGTYSNVIDLSDNSISRSTAGAPTATEAARELDWAVQKLHANRLVISTIDEVTARPPLVVVVKAAGTYRGYFQLLTEDALSTGIPNPWKGKFRIMWDRSPESGDENKIDVIDAAPGGPRPSIYIPMRMAGAIQADTSNPLARMIPFGVDELAGYGAGFPQSAVRIQT